MVVMLPEFTPNLPRGKKRSVLKVDGRIKTIQFKRSMSSLEVKNTIMRGFKHIEDLESWTFMDTNDNHLSAAKQQAGLDGEEVITRKGCLYVCQNI